jgi:hypothetical protein
VSAVYHNSWDVDIGIVMFLAEKALFLVQQFAHELINLFSIKIWRVLSLLEEKIGWVFKFFHSIQK